MNNINEKARQEMQEELKKYKEDAASTKSYFQLMKELTLWLQGKKQS